MVDKIKRNKVRIHDVYYQINEESTESEESEDDLLPLLSQDGLSGDPANPGNIFAPSQKEGSAPSVGKA